MGLLSGYGSLSVERLPLPYGRGSDYYGSVWAARYRFNILIPTKTVAAYIRAVAPHMMRMLSRV